MRALSITARSCLDWQHQENLVTERVGRVRGMDGDDEPREGTGTMVMAVNC